MSWCSGLEEICQTDVPLREHTWYGLGGPARWFVLPRNEEQLAAVVRRLKEFEVPWRVLGRGANVLVRDQGFDGAVIKLSGDQWERTLLVGHEVQAAAGVDITKLVRMTVDRGLSGLECLAGIPGSLGGIIRMNAGGRYGCVADVVREVRVMLRDGAIETRPQAACGFAYRDSALRDGIVLAASLVLAPGDPARLLGRFREIWASKSGEQPAVAARSAGCLFKNPPGAAAGRLIDEAGLKGHRCGGAEISRRHANFVVAHPGAAAQDVIDLISIARERVLEGTGIELQLEVEIW
jgi:UDP-N-acetylmuramate dehydrogenase